MNPKAEGFMYAVDVVVRSDIKPLHQVRMFRIEAGADLAVAADRIGQWVLEQLRAGEQQALPDNVEVVR